MKLIFWNLHNSIKAYRLLESALQNDADIGGILFSEFWKITSNIAAPSGNATDFWVEKNLENRVGCVIRKSLEPTVHRSSDFYTILGVKYRDKTYTIVVCHFLSRSDSELDAESFSQSTITEIKGIITAKGLANEIYIGDFNLPHTSIAFIEINGLNATNYIGTRTTKTTKKRKYKIFYTPISGYSGDKAAGPEGTYYKTLGRQSQSWHIYDNIFVNKVIAADLDKSACLIVSKLETTDLYDGQKINSTYSDHLPVQLALK